MCSFTNSLGCYFFENATLTCGYLGAPGFSEYCTANNGEAFTIHQDACSGLGGTILVDGVEYLDAAVTQDITATCVNGVLQLGGGITDTDGVSTIGCDKEPECKYRVY